MAIIKCRPELLEELYGKCAEVLISCFKEREENIRVDIIHAFSELLAATVETPSLSVGERTTNGPRPAARQKHAVELLRCRLPAIMKATNKQLKNCPRITVAALHVLRNLCLVLEGGLDGYMGSLLASFHLCLTDKKKQVSTCKVQIQQHAFCGILLCLTNPISLASSSYSTTTSSFRPLSWRYCHFFCWLYKLTHRRFYTHIYLRSLRML